jgi:hypothetical protein
MIRVDVDGHIQFTYASEAEITNALRVAHESHTKGNVMLDCPLYSTWLSDYGRTIGLKEDLLTWTTVFIPKLLYSLMTHFAAIVHLKGEYRPYD